MTECTGLVSHIFLKPLGPLPATVPDSNPTPGLFAGIILLTNRFLKVI